ncbi:MAG: type II secretion system F family protein [bacterium]|nr:type II secretion system F family protein [bacterium]
MSSFAYKIVTKENKVLEGEVDAPSKIKAEEKFRQEGSTVLFVSPKKTSLFAKELSMPSFGFPITERIFFFRNLATMLGAGLSLADAMRVLEEQARSSGVKKAIVTIIHDVENGRRFSDAMRKFPNFFSDFLIEAIHVGELTGQLADTLDRISTDLEHDHDLRRKVQGAMAYPLVVLTVMTGVVITLTGFVLPKIADLFKELNAPLPMPTRILLGGSGFIRSSPFAVIGVFAALAVGLFLLWKNKKGRYFIHYAFLKIPVFGDMLREFNLARFFRALESLFASGISLVRSVEIAKKILKNDVYRQALDGAHPILIHGAPLSDALKLHPFLFPTQTRRIIEVGERTGKLEEIFRRVTSYYERALHHKTQMLASLIEPVLIVFIGVVVGGLALSVFLPIYQATSVF